MANNKFRICIVCGRLGDVDGVSLEVNKWIEVFKGFGHEIFTIAGKYGSVLDNVQKENQLTLEKIGFHSKFQNHWEPLIFPNISKYPPHFDEDLYNEFIHELETRSCECANLIFGYIQEHDIDVLIGENTNAMPMTLVAGMALYKLSVEKRVATIFHHHDFWWERSRFSNSHIERLLGKIMPPALPGLEHLVISSYAAHVLSCLKRVRAKVVPNCEDFDQPPVPDDYNRDFRKDLGFKEDDILIVQPTRIVRRKKIEDSIELVSKLIKKYPELKPRVKFVISLYQGDEPDENYIEDINVLAGIKGVPISYISDRVVAARRKNEKSEKMYTNRDVLVNADLVTYLPIWEGFGNALLEAIAAKVPVVVAQYLVYKTDIRISSLRTIEIRDQYSSEGILKIPDSVIDRVHKALADPDARQKMVERNFKVMAREFGFPKLRENLKDVLDDYGDEIRASRKRIHISKTFYHV
ncbi:MAG: glycosyltransferase family 4 protein [Deltaproteobacteria bacterium]|nr:glycosyltransferase family 4 protein [Deltaproteobacteria bacterium]